jgi:uncharacterized membrane protein YwaF
LIKEDIDKMMEEEKRKSHLRYSKYRDITRLIGLPISILFIGLLILFIARMGIGHYHEKGSQFLIAFYGAILISSLGVNVVGYLLLKRTKLKNTPYEKIADLILVIVTMGIITFIANYFFG